MCEFNHLCSRGKECEFTYLFNNKKMNSQSNSKCMNSHTSYSTISEAGWKKGWIHTGIQTLEYSRVYGANCSSWLRSLERIVTTHKCTEILSGICSTQVCGVSRCRASQEIPNSIRCFLLYSSVWCQQMPRVIKSIRRNRTNFNWLISLLAKMRDIMAAKKILYSKNSSLVWSICRIGINNNLNVLYKK